MVARDADIYGVAAITTTLVEQARSIHHTSPTVTAAFGRLLTGALLIGTFLKEPEHRVLLQINSRGLVKSLLAEADGRGRVRGYVGEPCVDVPSQNGKLDVGGIVGKGMLHVIREVGAPLPTTGTVPLVSGEIAEDIATYLSRSEQIPSAVSLGVFVRPGNIVSAAGGFMIQFQATVADDIIDHIEHALAETPPVTAMIQEGYQPQEMLQRALGALPMDVTRHTVPLWACRCSRERVVESLVAMGEEELRRVIMEDGQAEVRCEFCTTEYAFTRGQLGDILADAMSQA
jgi:molecular chaperone Hsp33